MEDILVHIFMHLSLEEICLFRSTCQTIYFHGRSPLLWKHLLERDYSNGYRDPNKKNDYEIYISCKKLCDFLTTCKINLIKKNLHNISSNDERIYLYYNKITILPTEIGLLNKVRELNLGHNELTFLPSEIGQLTNLGTLYLHYNELVSLPNEIMKLNAIVY